jgi:hypothetical protein
MPPFGIPSRPTLRDEGVVLPSRSGGIDFIGAGVTATDDPTSGRTLVTIPGASGGGSTYNFTGSGLTGVIDVKQAPYSATGNGTTDDTLAIQAALDAAQAVKGIVYFPPGTYLITSTLTIMTAGITVIGAGPFSSIIKHKNTALAIDTFYVNANGTKIENLQITSDGWKTAGWAIRFADCGVVEVRGLTIYNAFGGIGFIPTVGQTGTGRVSYCDISAFKYGIQCGGDDIGGHRFIELHIDNCVVWGFKAGPLGSESYQGEIGLYLPRTDGCYFSNMDTIGWQYGVKAGYTNCWYSNVLCDSCNVGWEFYSAACSAHFLNNCYAVSTMWGSFPPSPLPYTPAVPASGVSFLYDYANNSTVTITGGTGVSVTKNGASVTSPIIVNRGDTLVLTYSSAPTWVFTSADGFPAGPAGMILDGCQGIYLDGFYCRGGDAAIKIGSGTTDCRISGARLSHANSPGNPIRRAIQFQNHYSPGLAVTGVTNIRISDSLLAGTVAGIDWGTASVSGISVTENTVQGGMTGTLPYGAGTNRTLVKGNLGLNPPGALTPPALPPILGGPGVITNPFPYDCTVYLSGGTGLSIAVNGISIPVSGPIRVPAGATVSISYSVAPTWTWVGE